MNGNSNVFSTCFTGVVSIISPFLHTIKINGFEKPINFAVLFASSWF